MDCLHVGPCGDVLISVCNPCKLQGIEFASLSTYDQGLREEGTRGTSYPGPEGTRTRDYENMRTSFSVIKSKITSVRQWQYNRSVSASWHGSCFIDILITTQQTIEDLKWNPETRGV